MLKLNFFFGECNFSTKKNKHYLRNSIKKKGQNLLIVYTNWIQVIFYFIQFVVILQLYNKKILIFAMKFLIK